MKHPVVAVATCDLVRSQRYSTDQRERIDGILKREFKTLSRDYGEALHTPPSFQVTLGDEFQFVLSRPEKAFEVYVYYRALVALADVTPMLTFRCSIGIGEIAVENRRDSYSQDGEAFHRSRRGLDGLGDRRTKGRRRSRIVTGDQALDEVLDVVLMYQDLLEEGWTRAQWEAVRWRFTLPTYETIAARIGVAYQNVQKRLKAAKWDEFSRGLQFVERCIQRHLEKGEPGRFTRAQV